MSALRLAGLPPSHSRTPPLVSSPQRSSDYGTTWSLVSSGVTADLFAIARVNNRRSGYSEDANYDTNVAWVVGAPADIGGGVLCLTILKTTDGGLNWVRQATTANVTLRAVASENPNIVWASGDNGT